jgi:ligand-binding sensor domain-containing protein
MDGLCRYDEATDRFELARRIDAVAMSMATQQGRLWIATQGAGLYSYDGETWKQYRNSNDTTSLSDDQVNCVMPSQDGRLWVATQSGLCLYQPATDNFRRVSDVSVSSIIDGDHGDNLWLSTT